MMAFDESTPTAPDILTGKKNIVAFRARGMESGRTDGTATRHDCSNSGTIPSTSDMKNVAVEIQHLLLNNDI